jgi:hypothetical protein
VNRKTVIVFDQGVAPVLDMNDPVQSALRQSILDPRRYPYVRTIGRNLGWVLDMSSPAKMSREEIKTRDYLINTEAESFRGDFMDTDDIRRKLEAIYQPAYEAGQRSRNIE